MANPNYDPGDSQWDIIRKILQKLFNIYDRLGDIWGAIVANGGGGGGGSATAANQALQITQETNAAVSVSSIDGKIPTVGQKTMAASSPVVVASDQSAIPISATSLPLPTGAATLANQTTQITAEQAIQAALQGVSATLASSTNINNAVAGTRVQGSAVATPRGVIISAKIGNTGAIYIGDVTVTNNAGTKCGLILAAAQQSPILLVANLNQIYIDADTSGDGVGVLIL